MSLLRKPGPLLLLLLAGLAAAQPSKDTTRPPFKNDDSGEKKLKPPKIPKKKLPKPPTRPPGAPSSQDQRTHGEMPDFVTPLMKHVDTNGDDLISREEVDSLLARHLETTLALMLENVDGDRNGEISFEEAEAALGVQRAQYDASDTDGDGVHSAAEVKTSFESELAVKVTRLFERFDVEPADGMLDHGHPVPEFLWRDIFTAGHRESMEKTFAFEARDADGDGTHSRAELERALAHDREARHHEVKRDADLDGDGSISRSEFEAHHRRRGADSGKALPSNIDEMFDEIDQNNDGLHHESEMLEHFKADIGLTVDSLMNNHDFNHDGKIDFLEYLSIAHPVFGRRTGEL